MMRHTISILKASNGSPQSGHTVKLYAWSSGSSGYTGSALYTYTDNSDGTYYVDITTAIKGTVVITLSGASTPTIPTNYIGVFFPGDNQPNIAPLGTT